MHCRRCLCNRTARQLLAALLACCWRDDTYTCLMQLFAFATVDGELLLQRVEAGNVCHGTAADPLPGDVCALCAADSLRSNPQVCSSQVRSRLCTEVSVGVLACVRLQPAWLLRALQWIAYACNCNCTWLHMHACALSMHRMTCSTSRLLCNSSSSSYCCHLAVGFTAVLTLKKAISYTQCSATRLIAYPFPVLFLLCVLCFAPGMAWAWQWASRLCSS